ncbi:uncharacterized protein ACBR49_001535 [Aulostomus maculatus]
MHYGLVLGILLALVWLGPACEASSLGLVVHVEPLENDGGMMLRAHFTAIVPMPCPALTGVCGTDVDCVTHTTPLPFEGTKPGSGWCVRQWQRSVASNFSDTILLGSNTPLYVSLNAGPHVRANSGKLNQPPYVALPPPLRARANCPHHFPLSVKDLDGDKVRCRFAREDRGECQNCTQHSFIEMEPDQCMLTFTGAAPAGQYSVYLMAEDLIPSPKTSHISSNDPLSSIPVHLSLTVEESSTSCSDEPVATAGTPKEDTTLFILPYQQETMEVMYTSELESVSEIAVVGPPKLFRVNFNSVGPMASLTMAWIRSENKLARLLPICFVANTDSLQSEPRCLWLYQKEMRTLPDGTELKCEKTEMTLVLPVSSLSNINLSELQLNSPTCPVSYNDTYLTARIPLSGCGTEAVHSGNELVYTNTLKTVRPFTMVSRQPSLILPLACRIPGVQATGPQYKINMPTETETFGNVAFSLKFYFPGEGPMANHTRNPKTRSVYRPLSRLRREAESSSEQNSTSDTETGAIGSKITELDLHVLSNCSVERAEMIVSNCMESETEDFAVSYPILEQGCATSNSTLEILTETSTSKVYRLDMSNMQTKGTTMYVKCTVNLCIATMPSDKCPDLCSRSFDQRVLLTSLYTKTYTVKSGAVSLVVTTPSPRVTRTAPPVATPTKATNGPAATPCSRAPTSLQPASFTAVAVILTTISIFLQVSFLH